MTCNKLSVSNVLVAMWCLTGTFVDAGVRRTSLEVSNQLRNRVSIHTESELVAPPAITVEFQITTGVGIPTVLTAQVYETSDPIAMICWDLDSDGFLDLESSQPTITHTFASSGNVSPVIYAFDLAGRVSKKEIQVTVDDELQSFSLKSDYRRPDFTTGLANKRLRGNSKSATAGERFALLVADSENRFYEDCQLAYNVLVDPHYGYSDANIIFVSNKPVPFPGFPDYDSSRIDYAPDDLDLAYNELISRMTSNDHLLVFSSAHGTGYFDSSVVEYDPGFALPFEHQDRSDRIFTSPSYSDPDLFTIEQNFKLVFNKSKSPTLRSFGMNQWMGVWSGTSSIGSYVRRDKMVATFSGLTFTNDVKTSDTDIYIEEIWQRLASDADNDFVLDAGETWDYDGDGNPPIALVGDGYVFDEGDWSSADCYMYHDPEHGFPGGIALFDANFDGKADIDRDCFTTLKWDSPVVRGTDTDNDGMFVGIDLNYDGDMLDSCGVNESGFWGIDNDFADFLDALDYASVRIMMQNCFSGGFINDVSRASVVIATASPEGTISWSQTLTANMMVAFGNPGNPKYDTDTSGCVSFLEAFHYLDKIENVPNRYRFDDNGDRVGHGAWLPIGGDGETANSWSLADNCIVGDARECGDFDADFSVDIGDLTLMVNYLFISGDPAPVEPVCYVDFDNSNSIDIADLTALVAWLQYGSILTCSCGE